MIGNILDNTTELYMIKYAFGEIFSSGGPTLYKNPPDQIVCTYVVEQVAAMEPKRAHAVHMLWKLVLEFFRGNPTPQLKQL